MAGRGGDMGGYRARHEVIWVGRWVHGRTRQDKGMIWVGAWQDEAGQGQGGDMSGCMARRGGGMGGYRAGHGVIWVGQWSVVAWQDEAGQGGDMGGCMAG